MDLNRDGILAASSARKLDKAGYSLQERTALVAPRESACGGLDLAGALANVLVLEEGPSAPPSAELLSVSQWAGTHLPKECLDILEVSWGEPVLSRAARLKGYSVGPAITHGGKAYSVQWDLLKSSHVAAVVGALDLLRPRRASRTACTSLLWTGPSSGGSTSLCALPRRTASGSLGLSRAGAAASAPFLSPRFRGVSLELTTANSQARLAGVVLWLRSPASGYRISAFPRPVSGAESPMLWATFPTTMGKARLLTSTFRARLSALPSRTLV